MTILEICVVEPEYAFVCGAWGGLTADMIEKVELEIRENPPEGSAGKECIFVSAQWIDDEHDYIGGVRMVINAGYWDLNIVDAPVDCTTLHPAAEWTEADGEVLCWDARKTPDARASEGGEVIGAVVLAFIGGVVCGIYLTLGHPIYMRLVDRRAETKRIMRQAAALLEKVAKDAK